VASRRPAGTPGHLIGVDVGSTHVKAALVAPGSGVVYVARRATPTDAVPGGAWHRPEALLAAVESAVSECAAAAPGGGPVGIGIASMSEAGCGLDSRGRPIGRILAWYDSRPAPQAEWLERRIGAAALFARTGLRPEAKYTLPKLLWLREQQPHSIARMARWAGVAELVAHRLAGRLVTNASLACRSAAFDVAARRWDPELLALAGMTPDRMPELLPLGAAAGGLTASAAARLGLPSGIPVVVAGHDHMAGAIGAGAVRPGDALDSMGSAEVAALITAAPALDDEGRRSGFSCGCHALDGEWYLAGGLQASGALVEWFIDRFLPGAEEDRASPRRYTAFLDLLAQAGPMPARPLVRPYLRGLTAPRRDPSARLSIEGLTEADGLADLAAALVDGAAFHVRWMVDELARMTGSAPRRIRLIGGGTRNPRWLAAKAALGPGRLEVAETEEAAALGAALVAGIAAGVYASTAEALAGAAPSNRLTASAGLRSAYAAAHLRWLATMPPGAGSQPGSPPG
jgi:xylulokinase